MVAADRLSALPNSILVRILSFVPTQQAAATALLSRRWRSVWRRTSFLNLDSRPYAKEERDHFRYCTPTLEYFFEDAHAILAALRRPRRGSRRRRHGAGLKRLTLFLEEGAFDSNWYREGDDGCRVAQLLADPTVARVEELTISCVQGHSRDYRYFPPLASLPCAATLRVLELTRCTLEPTTTAPSPSLAFPCLTDLTLRSCFFLEGYLQEMVDAAPALTNLTLGNVSQRAAKPPGSDEWIDEWDYFRLPLRLRCSTVNSLVLVTFVDEKDLKTSAAGGSGIELDMPSLRFFRFQGYPGKLSLISPAPGLARVDLDVARRHHGARSFGWTLSYEPPSHMIASFSSTTALKVRLQGIEDIVTADEDKDGGVILPTFPNLKLLEIDGKYDNDIRNDMTAVATARLLRSCPVMSELRLRLAMRHNYSDEDEYKEPFDESMDRFERLARSSAVELGGVSDLRDALTNNCAFRCLEASLRKVTLRFEAKEVNCFPVQLAKFLAENAMVLEEMHVDDGSQFWPDHLCHKVEAWRAESFRRKNMPDMAAGFRVCQLPMDKPVGDSDEESWYGYDYD